MQPFPPLYRSINRAAIGLAGMTLALTAQPAFADQNAETFVQTILDEAEPALSVSDRDQMFDAIEDIVDKHVDMRRIGRFVLGQYARQMTDTQADVYYPLFKRYATQIYQNTLSDYAGQTLKVTGSVDRSERDIIVNSKLENPEPGDPFANAVIHWRVYRARDSKEMTVVDAGADNVWLAIEQRSQFTSIIANNGGREKGIDALIVELKKRVGG
ncbi:MlaC/ttg2D family ABC transporter substrate-binding protein [Hyphococcus lacteus]|uniref:ABC transporter substrate-binding protein n=1 Tax=Hyphococcus lacteus TaxID=3143536 RepID=A0ABV3Z7V8_9PROT